MHPPLSNATKSFLHEPARKKMIDTVPSNLSRCHLSDMFMKYEIYPYYIDYIGKPLLSSCPHLYD